MLPPRRPPARPAASSRPAASARPAPQRRHAGAQRGAALLIILLVLVLASASMLVSALGARRADSAELRTLALLGQAQEALIGYAQLHRRLPRPAASAINGEENLRPCLDDAACTGFLPWQSLGLSGVDAWGHLLRYSVAPALTDGPVEPSRASSDKIVEGRDAAGLYTLAGQAGCIALPRCVAAVVASSGARNLGVSGAGLAQANGAIGNLDEQRNATATVAFITRQSSKETNAAGGEFDDMLAWLPLATLLRRMDAAGALPDDGKNRRSAIPLQ